MSNSEYGEFLAKNKVITNTPEAEFLSTHPADETRIRNLEKLIPEAMQYYKS
jgi:Zn-dependent protease with chaperone function